MTTLPRRLTLLLAEDDEHHSPQIRTAINDCALDQRLITLPDTERVMSYLQGLGKYSDRGTWPLPSVLLLGQRMRGLSGLDTLAWLRREPRLACLPVVILAENLLPDQARLADRLKAACCPQSSGGQDLIKTLRQAISRALSLVRGGWFGSKSAYASPHAFPHNDSAPIRVWT